ncbi:uncharacterized protein LOC126816796 [Patella vulgata]|uniref:uncharacterized protein LOC126816796 n=1 Tax=Patella vulgata TaxID=6465 RepID=UPI00217F7B8C|nr:uncharacterized protein LOC126816796 [Patella vulgata]
MPDICIVTCLTRTAVFCDVNLLPADKTKRVEYTKPVRYLDSVTRTCLSPYQAVYGSLDVFVCQVDKSLKLDYSRDELICGDSCESSLNFNSSTCEYWASVGECIFKLDYWCRCSFSCKVAPFCQKLGNYDTNCQCGIWAKAGRCDEPYIQIKCETTCQLRKTVTCAESQLPSAPGYAFQYTSPIRYLDTVTIECANGFDTTAGDYIHIACLANGSFNRSFYHSAITCIDPTTPLAIENTDICVCGCHVVYSNVSEYEVAKQKSLQIRDDLLVDTRNLSATIRKKISIPDYRPSAQGVGSLAVIILCCTVGCFILLDLRAFSRHLKMLKSNILD